MVKIGYGMSTFYLLDVDARKRAYDYASGLQGMYPELAADILMILVNSQPALEVVDLEANQRRSQSKIDEVEDVRAFV